MSSFPAASSITSATISEAAFDGKLGEEEEDQEEENVGGKLGRGGARKQLQVCRQVDELGASGEEITMKDDELEEEEEFETRMNSSSSEEDESCGGSDEEFTRSTKRSLQTKRQRNHNRTSTRSSRNTVQLSKGSS
jgi:hypothetical protein